MGRRPLCLVALLFVLWVLCTQKIFPGKDLGGTEMEADGGNQQISLPDLHFGQIIRVRGEIYRQEKKNTNQIYLKNNSILSGTHQESYDSNILIYTEEEGDYQIGNLLEVTGKWKEPEAASNPGQFDMAEWYRAQNVGFTMSRCRIMVLDGRCDVLRQTVAEIRSRLTESFYGIAEEGEASLLCAMLLGDKNGLSGEEKELYQKSGISHVLAISGLHISMLGMLLFGTVRKLGLSLAGAGILSGGLMGAYCIMTGMGVSTARAFLMFLVYLGAQASGRTYDLKSSLSLAVLLLLFENPLLLFQGGFQLSVLAVAGLAYLYPILKKRLEVKNKLADSLLVSLSVQLFLFPCLLYHFYEFSAAGLFLNLLILPGMSILLLAGLFSSILGLFSLSAGTLAFAPCHYILRYMEVLCTMSLKIPGARQIWGRPEPGSIVLYYGILLTFLLILEREDSSRGNMLLWGSLLALGTAGLSVHPLAGLEMTFLDVGQGDSIFWQTGDGTSFLCDGGSSSVSQVGKYRILPFLKCRGIRKLDYLFLTHMDADHVNGACELLKEDTGVTIGCLVLPDIQEQDETCQKILSYAEQKRIPAVKFHDGVEMCAKNWSLECLAPEKGMDGTDKNASSLVLLLEYGSFRALLTGDIEGEGEQRLIGSGELKPVSVLKAAHHGSKNSTPREFLDLTQPAASVISCGKDNSYGHPSPELLKRLEETDTVIYTTMEQGAVTVITDGEQFSVEGYRN